MFMPLYTLVNIQQCIFHAHIIESQTTAAKTQGSQNNSVCNTIKHYKVGTTQNSKHVSTCMQTLLEWLNVKKTNERLHLVSL